MILGIYCSGSLGKEILNLIMTGQTENRWEKIVFIDDISEEKSRNGFSILTFEEIKQKFSCEEMEIVIATGEPYYRETIRQRVKEAGYPLATLISRNVSFGQGTQFREGCIIFPFCYIGNDVSFAENVVVHAGAKVESECFVGCSSFVSLGAFVGAETKIGERVFIGPNAAIKDNMELKNDSILGIGAVLVKSAEECGVYVGNPARFLRKNESHKLFSNSVVGVE